MPSLAEVDADEHITLLIESNIPNSEKLFAFPKSIAELIFDYLEIDEICSIVNEPSAIDFLLNVYSMDIINTFRINTLARSASRAVDLYMEQAEKRYMNQAYARILAFWVVFAGIATTGIYYAVTSSESPHTGIAVGLSLILPLIFLAFCSRVYCDQQILFITHKLYSSVINKLPTLLEPAEWILSRIHADKKTLGFVKHELHEMSNANSNREGREKFGLFQKSIDKSAEEPENLIPCFLVCPK